ncbi:hypothetical protein [Nonomuraea salmonea]|uniref:hypothetical protein n=1 Tax=Nonomuraea salmonea TaxID=46181 RepID=UPI002FEC5DA0
MEIATHTQNTTPTGTTCRHRRCVASEVNAAIAGPFAANENADAAASTVATCHGHRRRNGSNAMPTAPRGHVGQQDAHVGHRPAEAATDEHQNEEQQRRRGEQVEERDPQPLHRPLTGRGTRQPVGEGTRPVPRNRHA